MHTKKTLFKTLGLLIAMAVLLALLPGAVLADDPPTEVTVCATGCDHTSIQAAINAVNVGDTVRVKAGTYTDGHDTWGYQVKGQNLILEDDVIINNTGSCFQINGSHSRIVAESPGGAKCVANGGIAGIIIEGSRMEDIAIDGMEISGIDLDGNQLSINKGGIYSYQPDGWLSDVTIVNNYIHDIKYESIGDGYVDYYPYPAVSFSIVSGNLTIRDNRFVNTGGVSYNYETADARFNYWGAPEVTKEMAGGGKITGAGHWYNGATVLFSPWYTNAECTEFGPLPDEVYVDDDWVGSELLDEVAGHFFGYDAFASIQEAIDGAAPGATIHVAAGQYNDAGGTRVNKEGLTLLLADGVVVKNNSPCFSIEADYTRIIADTHAGAKCVPTGGWPGIWVEGYVKDLIIEKLEFDGTGEVSGTAFNFNGGGEDFQIVDNYVHDLLMDNDKPSNLIEINATISGVFDIQGNMFKGTAGINDMGNFDVDARYNSWGEYTVTSDMVDATTDSTTSFKPWTHVELFIEPAGDPWENYVVEGEEIKVNVTADLQSITGAAFAIEFDPTLVQVRNIDNKNHFPWPFGVDGYVGTSLDENISYDNDEGWIAFGGVSLTGVSGEENEERFVLFEITFETLAADTVDLAFIEGSDTFAMNPPVEDPFSAPPSNHVYPLALNDGNFNIFDLPTISSEDIQGYYLTGEKREFHVKMDNPDTGANYALMIFNYRLDGVSTDDIHSFEYYAPDIDDWIVMGSRAYETYGNCPVDPDNPEDPPGICGQFGWAPGGFGPVLAGSENESLFRVNFKTGFSEPLDFTLELYGKVDLSETEWVHLTTFTGELDVYDPPVLTPDIPAIFMSGEETDFSVDLTNPATGITTNVYAIITLTGVTPDQIASLTYFEDETGQYENLPFEYDPVTGEITIWYGPTTGFPIEPGVDIPAGLFKAIFDTDVHLDIDYTIVLYDIEFDPDRPLTSVSGSTRVYPNYALNGTVAMQGRTLRAGVPITLTGQNFDYVDTVESNDHISNNYSFQNVIADTYLFTTLQPRYLNVHLELGKLLHIIGAGQAVIPNLGLRGGNAIWEGHATSNNQIDIFDASEVGTKYGTGTINDNADVNFDGKVNIQDLALVGGNFDLTAEEAYQDWLADLGSVINITTGVSYDTIKGAIEDAVSGETLVLINDLTIEPEDYMHTGYYALMVSGKSITIDLFGHTLTSDADATVYINSSGALTLKDSLGSGKVENTYTPKDEEDPGGNAVGVYGTFILDDAHLHSVKGYALYNHYYNGSTYGTSNILRGTLTGYDRGIANCGVLTIHDAEINSDPYEGWDIDNSGYLTIAGTVEIKSLILKDGNHAPEVPGKGTLVLPAGADFEVTEEVYAEDGTTIIINAGATVAGINSVTAPGVYVYDGSAWVPN